MWRGSSVTVDQPVGLAVIEGGTTGAVATGTTIGPAIRVGTTNELETLTGAPIELGTPTGTTRTGREIRTRTTVTIGRTDDQSSTTSTRRSFTFVPV